MPPEQQVPARTVAATFECEVGTVHTRLNRVSWAWLFKRLFDIDLQHCPKCGTEELKIIAAILERPVIQKIMDYLGLDP